MAGRGIVAPRAAEKRRLGWSVLRTLLRYRNRRQIYPIGLAALCYAVLYLTASIRALDGWRHLVTAVGAFSYLSFRHAFRG